MTEQDLALLKQIITQVHQVITALDAREGMPEPISDAERALFRLLLKRRGVSSNHYLLIEGIASVIGLQVNADDGVNLNVEVIANDLFASAISITRHYPVRTPTLSNR